ncbi:MgtC/SapB family protein [Tissierella creatinini]|nr:MgtC/SapB family protein [Tissierella creatinini]TJX67501.1 MgtC/SapB family protein [Soehngenia saccharolytica]
MISNIELLIRLILSALVGGSIGIEREVSNRPAGLRTHILVSVGSTLIMLVSIYGFSEGDPARLAAQVVSGIGFLGAGTIMRTGNDIRGLTTAASLWVCAGIGLAIGAGFYLGGVITAVIVLISLILLSSVEKKVAKNTLKKIIIQAVERPGLIGDIGTLLGSYHISIKEITVKEDNSDDNNHLISLDLSVKVPNNLRLLGVFRDIYDINEVTNVIYCGKMISRKDIL